MMTDAEFRDLMERADSLEIWTRFRAWREIIEQLTDKCQELKRRNAVLEGRVEILEANAEPIARWWTANASRWPLFGAYDSTPVLGGAGRHLTAGDFAELANALRASRERA